MDKKFMIIVLKMLVRLRFRNNNNFSDVDEAIGYILELGGKLD